MSTPEDSAPTLCLPLPTACTDRTILLMMRRMGTHGLRDAQAVMLAMRFFGTGFRQPLVLLRCFMAEVAQASERSIMLSPCCARRMTRDEGLLLETLAMCRQNPSRAKGDLGELTGCEHACRAFTVALAFNNALANAGRQLEG